jgi:hypothetical protein
MMKASTETTLRSKVTDLTIEHYSDGTVAILDDATVEDFRHIIRAAYVVSDEAGHSLHRWVDAGRHAGLSWTDIGEVLGVTRQAAQQRFAQSSAFADMPRPETESAASDLICRTGMTAFSEVPVLDEEGRNGNALVGAAPLKLYFSPRGDPYENARVTALRAAPVIKRYEAAGWTYVLTWYPFHYFTRKAHSDE